jgi:hypothetical protein
LSAFYTIQKWVCGIANFSNTRKVSCANSQATLQGTKNLTSLAPTRSRPASFQRRIFHLSSSGLVRRHTETLETSRRSQSRSSIHPSRSKATEPSRHLHRISCSVQQGRKQTIIMDSSQRTQRIRQRAVAKASLTRMQTFIETGDRKLHEIQVRFDELPNIFNKFESAQSD